MSEVMQQYQAWQERGQELVARLREERRTVLERLVQIDNALNLLGVKPGMHASKKRKAPPILRGPVTPAQAKVLCAVRDSVAARGFPPTVRELAKAVGCKSINNVCEHINSLERKGMLTVTRNASRGLVITEVGMRILAGEQAGPSEGPDGSST